MISKGEKEKQRKDLNKFIEQNVQGINKIGLHKKGGGGRRPLPPLVTFKSVISLIILQFICTICIYFVFFDELLHLLSIFLHFCRIAYVHVVSMS